MRLRHARVAMLAFVFVLAACGGGGGSSSGSAGGGDPGTNPPPPAAFPDIPATDADAARFLTQASFGPNKAEIANLRKIGYTKWLDEQLSGTTAPPTLVVPYFEQLVANGAVQADINAHQRRSYWLWEAATAHDQLRLRMGLALSEIFVVTDLGTTGLNEPTFRFADYQDTLARDAFGSYRNLLEDVSLHPAMGFFLTYAGNRKADSANNSAPDENYGREVMQLMSIGLFQRNPDFTPVLDSGGITIPTYDQSIVKAMARVFTGWTYAGQSDDQYGQGDLVSYAPMECHPKYHDTAAKTIFNGIVLPAGGDCTDDLALALDALADHPNTAPFISRELIQRFVTSNPSPEYVGRVVDAWNASNGNLGTVIRTILLDVEARLRPAASDAEYGKAREPMLKLPALWRAFHATYTPDPTIGAIQFDFYGGSDMSSVVAQDVLRAPSVFNFFTPDFRLSAAEGFEGNYAPEFQILNEATYLGAVLMHDDLVWNYTLDQGRDTTLAPQLDVSELISLAEAQDYAGMVDDVNLLLFYGALPATSQKIMTDMLEKLVSQGSSPSECARSLLDLALDSPEFAIQR